MRHIVIYERQLMGGEMDVVLNLGECSIEEAKAQAVLAIIRSETDDGRDMDNDWSGFSYGIRRPRVLAVDSEHELDFDEAGEEPYTEMCKLSRADRKKNQEELERRQFEALKAKFEKKD